jgi:hypothetical protein
MTTRWRSKKTLRHECKYIHDNNKKMGSGKKERNVKRKRWRTIFKDVMRFLNFFSLISFLPCYLLSSYLTIEYARRVWRKTLNLSAENGF